VEPTLSSAVANQIWTILVEEVRAREEDRSGFIQHQGKGCTEWRFGGVLGFGGKFWNNSGRWYVNCYPEDLACQPGWVATIVRTNARLESLRAGLVDNRVPT
jgi:hypothetical protein